MYVHGCCCGVKSRVTGWQHPSLSPSGPRLGYQHQMPSAVVLLLCCWLDHLHAAANASVHCSAGQRCPSVAVHIGPHHIYSSYHPDTLLCTEHQNISHVWSWYIFFIFDIYHLHSADTGWISTDSTETGCTVMTRASQVSKLLCLLSALFPLPAGATPSFILRTSGPASFPSLLTSSMKRLRISMFCGDVDDLGAFENHFDNFDKAARCFLCFCLS